MPLTYIATRARRFFIYRVLHVDDTPHRIALGVAIGMFIAWTPTVGIQMGLTIAVAFLLRANKVVGLPWVWISNPVTMLPIYWGNYRLGKLLLGGEWPRLDLRNVVRAPGWFHKFYVLLQETSHVAWPLWLGSILVATAWAIPTYFIIRWSVRTYRRARGHDIRTGRPIEFQQPSKEPD